MLDNEIANVASILEIHRSWAPQMGMIVLNGLLTLMATLLRSLLFLT